MVFSVHYWNWFTQLPLEDHLHPHEHQITSCNHDVNLDDKFYQTKSQISSIPISYEEMQTDKMQNHMHDPVEGLMILMGEDGCFEEEPEDGSIAQCCACCGQEEEAGEPEITQQLPFIVC